MINMHDIWKPWHGIKTAAAVIKLTTAAALLYIELKSDDSFHNHSAVKLDGMHTTLLIFVEIKTEQVSFINMIIVQILGQLFLALRIVFVAVPDFHLDDILFSEIVNDHISTPLITGLRFDIIVSCSVDNWSQIKAGIIFCRHLL